MKTRTQKQETYFYYFFKKNNMVHSINALSLVNLAHKGLRKDGQEERSHLFEVLGLAIAHFDGRMSYEDLDVIVTLGALHDLVEDYSDQYSFKYLKSFFPKNIIRPLKKVTKWKTFTKTKRDYDLYHKNIGKDFLAIITKANDRIHNLSSCYKVFTTKRKKEYVEETLQYIIPNLKKARFEYAEHYVVCTFLIQQLKMLCEFVEYTTKTGDTVVVEPVKLGNEKGIGEA